MCPSGAPSGAQKWSTWLKVGHIYYIKVGHNKICAQVGHKVGHKSGAHLFLRFGLKIIEENIEKFASNYDKVIYSNPCIQDFRSEKCGHFCIAFLKNVKTVNQYDRFINMFDDCNLYMNDFIVHDIVKKIQKNQKKY